MDIGNVLKLFMIILGVFILFKTVVSLAKKTNDRAVLSSLGSFIGIVCCMRISVKADKSGETY